MWAFWEIAKSIMQSLIGSRVGQIAIAFAIAWVWSWHNTSLNYEKRISAEKAAVEAAYRAEIQREQYAAREIAEAATRRAEDDAEAAKDMQSIIDDYANKLKDKPNAKVASDNCDIDSNFVGVLQQLQQASDRHSRSAKRSRKVR